MMLANAKTVKILLLVNIAGAVTGLLLGTVGFFTPGWLKESIYHKNGVKKKNKTLAFQLRKKYGSGFTAQQRNGLLFKYVYPFRLELNLC